MALKMVEIPQSGLVFWVVWLADACPHPNLRPAGEAAKPAIHENLILSTKIGI